jgi:ubiquinone/menaquinone biosynthesis C-methylase UbiE
MHERRFHGNIERLRSPERLERLEVDRVVELCLGIFPARSMLDVGAGTGIFAEAFAKLGLKVSGIDANPEMLESARVFVPEGRFQTAPAEAIPFRDASFDLVFLGHVLHEADDPLAALREARRVARQGVAVLEWPYIEEAHGPQLAHRLKPETVHALAEQSGFEHIDLHILTHMSLYCMKFTPLL